MSRTWLLTDDFPPTGGGVAVWTWRVAEALAARGEAVTVAARAVPGAVAPPRVQLLPVQGPSFGRHGGRWIAWTVGPRLGGGDRVLATTWPLAAHLLPRIRSVGATLHVIGHGSDLTRPTPAPRAQDAVWRAADHRWTVSRYLADHLARRGIDARVLPAAVLPTAPGAHRPGTWVLPTRAVPTKGGERFLTLAAALGARPTVLGDGPALSAWRAHARRLGLDAELPGAVSHEEVLRRLPTFDLVFLLPRPYPDGSGAEGLGLALVEGAMAGVAGVTTAVGGAPEAVGPAGLVLGPPEEDVARLRAWLAAEDPTARGLRARDHALAHHGVGRLVDRLLQADPR